MNFFNGRYYSFTFMMIVFCVIMLSCQPAVDLQVEKQNLLQADSQFAQTSIEQGAAEAFKMFMTEDAVQMPAGLAPIYGNQNIYESMKQGESDYTLEWEPQDGEVSKCADMGWTWGKYVFSWIGDSGEAKKAYGKYVNVWQKQSDGSWKVKVDIGNQGPVPTENDEKPAGE